MLLITISVYATNDKPELNETARKYYSDQQVESFSASKIAKLNYYYTESFELDLSKVREEKLHEVSTNFDITNYESYRKRNRDHTIVDEETGVRIKLYSWETVFHYYKLIENNYN
ncbi:MAG: hypothetical protein C0594_15730 [Marinilabiliales bacterium]|nr:MAG: hypothetical protein C0594_15730 [Marinilabiliales bacterium]